MRYFLELAYDGTAYHGWQVQPQAKSVQATFENALSTLIKEEIRLVGSSRTDAGVHARQQYAHFEASALPCPPEEFCWKLNSFLPNDLAAISLYPVLATQHARFDAVSRKYIYRLHTCNDPFLRHFSLCYKRPLDTAQMNTAAASLLNFTNFQCFSRVKTDVTNFECRIMLAEWQQNGHCLEFHIVANRFLRGMVRAIVGTILDVGLGKITVQRFEDIIRSCDRKCAGPAVEGHALTLEQVNYPLDYFKLNHD